MIPQNMLLFVSSKKTSTSAIVRGIMHSIVCSISAIALCSCTHSQQNSVLSDSVAEVAFSPLPTASSPSNGLPGFIDCIGDALFEPRSITTRCADPTEVITNISWNSWDDYSAQGIGFENNNQTVNIILSQPRYLASGQLAFTSLHIDGIPVTP